MNEYQAAYKAGLTKFLSSDLVSGVNSSDYGLAVNKFNSAFKSNNEDFTEEDLVEIGKIGEQVLSDFKIKTETPRFRPKQDEREYYYGAMPDLSSINTVDGKIAAIDSWKDGATKRAQGLRPADAEDLGVDIDSISNEIKRIAVGEKANYGWAADKGVRIIQGATGMISPFVPGMGEFLAENLPENPEMDNDFSSQFAAGIGDVFAQGSLALSMSATVGPAAAASALSALYAARSAAEGYKEEMKNSGDPTKAAKVGIAGIPGSQFELFADKVLFGLGAEGASIAKSFAAATTREAKEEVLANAIPSLGKKALLNGVNEATIGSIATDFTTGYGRYVASGDERYIPSSEDLIKGALIEGTLGFAATPVFSGNKNEVNAAARDLMDFPQNKAKASEIQAALKEGNYGKAVDLATKDYTKTEEPAPSISTSASAVKDEVNKDANPIEQKKEDDSLFSPSSSQRVFLKKKLAEYEKSGDVESANRIKEVISGSYKKKEEFSFSKELIENNANFKPFNQADVSDVDSYMIESESGDIIQSSKNTIFIDSKNFDLSVLNTHYSASGGSGVGIFMPPGEPARLLFIGKTQDGKNQIEKGKTKFSVSTTPKSGYIPVEITESFISGNGNAVVTGFKPIAGKIKSYVKSEASVAKKNNVIAQAKSKASIEDFETSGINDAIKILDTTLSTKQLSENGFNIAKREVEKTFDKLQSYLERNPTDKTFVEDIQSELLQYLEIFESIKDKKQEKQKPIAASIFPSKEEVDSFRNAVEAEIDNQQPVIEDQQNEGYTDEDISFIDSIDTTDKSVETIPLPAPQKSLKERIEKFRNRSDAKSRNTFNRLAKEFYNLSETVNGKTRSYALIEDNGSNYKEYKDGTRVQLKSSEYTLSDRDSPDVMYKKEFTPDGVFKVYQDGRPSVKLFDRKGRKVEPKSSTSSDGIDTTSKYEDIQPPTSENVTLNPSGLFESEVYDDEMPELDEPTVIEHTVEGEYTPKILTADELNAEIERTKELAKDDDSYLFTLKELEDQLALLATTNTNTIPEALVVSENKQDPEIIFSPAQSEDPISSKVDEFISSLPNEKARSTWTSNKNTIVEFINKTMVDPDNSREGFTSLGATILKKAEEIAISLNSDIKSKIEKDSRKRSMVSKWEKEYLKRSEAERNDSDKEADKTRYSIASSKNTSGRISESDALDYISKNNLPVSVVNTRKTTEDGHQWNGRTQFAKGKAPVIHVNVANIGSIDQLKNVINEELAHIAYNSPSISTTINSIVKSTEVRDGLNSIYNESEVFEESVVKRMADLVDSFNSKGTFDKVFTAIKSYVKEKLGLNLNDNDLSYIAYRAIVRASKNTTASSLDATKYSLSPDNIDKAKKIERAESVSYIADPVKSQNEGQFGEYQYRNAVDDLSSDLVSNFSAHGSRRIIDGVKGPVERAVFLANAEFIKGDFGTVKGESIGVSNTFTNAESIVIKNISTGEEVVVYNAPSPDKVVPLLAGTNRKIIRPSDIESWMKESASKDTTKSEADSDLFKEVDDIISLTKGQVSTEKRETFKKLHKALRKKIEKDLIVDEPEAWNAIKSVKFGFLSDEDLRSYNSLVDEFVRTRSKSTNPKFTNRDSAQEVIAKSSELAKKGIEGQFEFLKIQHEFLEDKDLYRDFQGDIDLVIQQAKDYRGSKDSDLPSNKNDEAILNWQNKIFDIQEILFENKDFVRDRMEEMFPQSSSISTSNMAIQKYLSKFTGNLDDVMGKFKEVFKQRMNQLMEDPTDKSYRDIRQQYYGLMDFFSDGYALNIQDFVTRETLSVLNTEIQDNEFVDAFNSKWMKKFQTGAASFFTNASSLGNKVYEATHKLTANFREGLLAAERIHEEFTKPAMNDLMQIAVSQNGGREFDGHQLNLAGIFSLARAFKVVEGATKGVLASRSSIQDSIDKYADSKWKGHKEASSKHTSFLNSIFEGINEETPDSESLTILESNAEKALGKPLVDYVRGISDMFLVTKPLAKFSSEFGLGRPFEEWVNYTPAFAIRKDGHPVDTDLIPLQATSDDINLMDGSDFDKNTTMMRSGMGSLMRRDRRLGDGKVYAFNINNAEARMRINLTDYLTLPQRRELTNVISGKGTVHHQFAKMLKDKGSLERVSHIQNTIRTMWSNSIQSASYITEFQAGMNLLSNMWASGKLSSFYQLPAQLVSNTIPYFIANSGSPKKIKYLFDAIGILMKHKSGHELSPRLQKVVERVSSTIKGRSQEQYLDKSIALDVNSSDMWQTIKSSSFWPYVKKVNKLREKVLFAPFTYSDLFSGEPMLLANIMANEEDAGRTTSWDDLTYNAESFVKALDETERFIGIGASSRRGVWTNNKNGWLSVLRNILSAFSSHRINNATNFFNEMQKLKSGVMTDEEKSKSVRYMVAIQAQSAAFSVVKWAAVGMFYNLLSGKMGEEENEDELEKLYARTINGNVSKGQKKIIQSEVSMREKIRNEFLRVKDANSNTDVLLFKTLQDMVSNSFLIPAVSDVPLNAVIHLTKDKYEVASFKVAKEMEIKRLKEGLEKAKASKNTSVAVELQKDISRWESQEAVQLAYENRSMIPIEGMYGGVLKDGYNFVDAVANFAIDSKPMSVADIFLGAGIIGMAQPDINRIARMYSKKSEYEQEYKKSLESLEKKRKD